MRASVTLSSSSKKSFKQIRSICIHRNRVCRTSRGRFISTDRRRWQPSLVNVQNEIIEMDVTSECVEEGEKKDRGRRLIRWSFENRLWANNTPVLAKCRQNINSDSYVRYSYVYVLVNNDATLRMVSYKQQRGSPCINTFPETECWLNYQGN